LTKYNAKKTKIDGIMFDSKAEAHYFVYLKGLEKRGLISELELQPKVYLTSARILYKPDFKFFDVTLQIPVYVDVKGMTTPVFQIKKRLWRHYGAGILRLVKKGVVTEEVKTLHDY